MCIGIIEDGVRVIGFRELIAAGTADCMHRVFFFARSIGKLASLNKATIAEPGLLSQFNLNGISFLMPALMKERTGAL